jgi:hypothetical protein
MAVSNASATGRKVLFMTRMTCNRAGLREVWAREMSFARDARHRHDAARAWTHLERAHILSQPLAGRHVRTHLTMLAFGVRTGRRREIVGQLVRLTVAAPGSWSRRYPIGNTGGADVSPFAVMPTPEDLQAVLEPFHKRP